MRSIKALGALLAGALALGACTAPESGSSIPPSPETSISSPSPSESPSPAGTLRVVSGTMFSLPRELVAEFEQETGATVEFVVAPESVSVIDYLAQNADDLPGDVVVGLDNTVVGLARREGLVEPYESPALPAESSQFVIEGLTPIDFGDVCVNADVEWFEERETPIPTTLEELADPQYRDLLVMTDPSTSSTGRSFLIASIEIFDDQWRRYWQELDRNGIKLVRSWEIAYAQDFTGTEGGGERPLTIAFASSPAYTLTTDEDGETVSRTVALLGTCMRQIDFAAVLADAEQPELARQFIDFLLSPQVQTAIPEAMFKYPVLSDIDLPENWREFAPLPQPPLYVEPEVLDENLEDWLSEFSELDLSHD